MQTLSDTQSNLKADRRAGRVGGLSSSDLFRDLGEQILKSTEISPSRDTKSNLENDRRANREGGFNGHDFIRDTEEGIYLAPRGQLPSKR